VALIAFFSFLANWSNYFLAFVLLSDDKLYNLPVGLTALISGSGALSNSTASEIPIRMPEAIQASILVIAPVLIIFLISQKFVRTGMLSGAEKGLGRWPGGGCACAPMMPPGNCPPTRRAMSARATAGSLARGIELPVILELRRRNLKLFGIRHRGFGRAAAVGA
jgi:hypothetical protein